MFADELLRFAGVGVISTLAYMALFALLEPRVGGYTANAVAIVACGVGNTAAHRGMAGTARHGLDRLHRVVTAAALLGVSLTFTTAALAITRGLGMDELAPELIAVTLANIAAAAFRFSILRTWVFRPRFGTHLDPVALADGSGESVPLPVPAPMSRPAADTFLRGPPDDRRHHFRRTLDLATWTPVTWLRPAPGRPTATRSGSRWWTPPVGPSTTPATPPTVDPSGDDTPAAPLPPAGLVRRLVRGKPGDPAWVRPSLIALLVGTGFLYIWGLGDSGWANSFYSAAVQAGTKSWKAFFFGSFDSSNFITVDKPPASLWVMELSARIFGVNSWSILVPQALEGVATVGLLYLCVRRWFAPAAALLAGAVLALTPVATLMFRFNNPDALLALLLVGAAYATIRAIEAGRTRWMVLAGALIGFGFITKMLQAFILMPVLALVYLVAGPPKLGRRILQLIYTGIALVVSAGWWVAAVELTPASSRPYVGGSTNNNLFNLIFGYNGIGRLSGNETGSVVGGGAGGAGGHSMWGPTGWDRLFLKSMGGQISWLIPGSLIGLVAVLWLTRRAPRTDRTRAAFLLFGGWLLLTGLIFSYAQGIIHPYYTVALAPAVGALVGMGAWTLWSRRTELFPRLALATAVVATVVWSFVLLGWSPDWYPALRWVVLFGGLVAAVAVVVLPRSRGVLAAGIAGLGITAVLAGPAAYSLDTASTPNRAPSRRPDRR